MLKNKIFYVTFFALCAILSGTKITYAQAVTDNSQDNQASVLSQPSAKIVKAIDIQGNKSIGIAQILARIKTRVGEEYQEAVVSDDLKRLYSTGHFSDVQIDHEDLDDGYKVIVRLKEKPIVDEITFSKIRNYTTRFLLSKMKTKKDKFLDNKILKDDVNTIEDLYKKKGLSQVKVDVESFVDDTTNKASLHFIIREGFKVKIKLIYIYGNVSYPDKKIIKVMKSRWAWLFGSGLFKEDVLEQDMTAIQSFYEQNGFLDTKVTYQDRAFVSGNGQCQCHHPRRQALLRRGCQLYR